MIVPWLRQEKLLKGWREMRFYIYTKNGNGSGIRYHKKEDFLKEIVLMIKDCIANDGTYFSVDVGTDANCFYCNEED